jgi:hypothetical protein
MDELGAYQVVLSDEIVPFLDGGFLPLDWRANPTPELREIAIHAHVGRSGLFRNHKITGAISAKFYVKTNLRSLDVNNWITANPGYDVYLINSVPFIPYINYNSIERGCLRHQADFDIIMRALCNRVGVNLPDDLRRQSNKNSALNSCWFASQGFWRQWMADAVETLLSRDILGESLYQKIYSTVDYFKNSPSVILAPFLYERLISLYIENNNIKALHYKWTHEEILNLRLHPIVKRYLARMMPIIDEIDEKPFWTPEDREFLRTESMKEIGSVTGKEMNVVDSENFNLPIVRCP